MKTDGITTSDGEQLTKPAFEALQLLNDAELFSGLQTDSLIALARSARWHDLAARETLVRSGEGSRGIYLVESGMVKLTCFGPRGNEKVVALLDAGKTFGQAELFSGREFRYEILTVRKSRVIVIPGIVVRSVVQHDAQLAQNLLECMGRQFDALIRDIAGSAALNASQRVVAYLLARVDKDSGENPETPASLHLPVTKAALAARLGIAPETISRTFAMLEASQLIEVRRRDITILDRNALESLLSDPDMVDSSTGQPQRNRP